MAKAADLNSFVQQRGGKKDCVLAALATVTSCTYEEMARALNISLSGKGLPDIEKGVDLLHVCYPLLKLGWLATPLVAKEHPELTNKEQAPTADEIKALLPGRQAVIGYSDPNPEVGEHALAWNGQYAIDCSNGEIVALEDLTLNCALILEHESGSRARS